MTNEELTVLAGLASELAMERTSVDTLVHFRDQLTLAKGDLEKENKRLIDECNRLRESEANALNAEREALCDRDDARKKLGEWARFINFTIYTALDAAKDRKDCRKVVKDTLDAMVKFNAEHEVTITEGGMAK